MPTVISYGEDALTYWALTARTQDILDQLGDDSATEDALVIYRPSFGRHGKARGGVGLATNRAEFGELDAILATSYAIYLVESKWHRSSELQDGALVLRDEQVRRHKIMGWYLQRWFEDKPGSWQAFLEANEETRRPSPEHSKEKRWLLKAAPWPATCSICWIGSARSGGRFGTCCCTWPRRAARCHKASSPPDSRWSP